MGEVTEVLIKRMQGRVSVFGAVLLGGWLVAAPAAATTVGGGGSKKTDCLAVFETSVVLPANQRKIICVDGNPACDSDATIDGQCTFDLGVCVNDTSIANCTLSGVESIFVDHSADNGDPKFDPDFQAIQDRIDNELDLPNTDPDDCTGTSFITVRVRGPFPGNRCQSGKKKLKMTTQSEFDISAGKTFTDKDAMKFICKPAPTGCDPQTLYSGTFDRIQRQILDQNCATSGCHDSQTFAGGLLLETGASYPSLVGVPPVNFAAGQLGWLRVTAGNEGTSYLYQKLQGGLEPSLGERMPFQKGKLKSYLREIIRLWIVAGAPEMGWVSGTE
ncbi:MAG: hypothetical protein P8R42_15590 [Candidatus Binatia bacterium]|nr:hypothetical protein [Candidatus Binatia bacterium]